MAENKTTDQEAALMSDATAALIEADFHIAQLHTLLSDAAEALSRVVDERSTSYRAGNGRQVSIQSDDGERCDIIHSDITTDCEGVRDRIVAQIPHLEKGRAENTCASVVTKAVVDCLAERHGQQTREGFSLAHDDQHTQNELPKAAISYLLAVTRSFKALDWWPWDRKWFKPGTDRRNLVKAVALLLAEIERIDRAMQKDSAP